MKTSLHLPLQLYCKPLVELFQKSISSPNPALFLYQKNARNDLFMAESLARLLTTIFTDKEIEQAHKTFKKLEDAFGQIDNYDTLFKQFSKNKSIKKEELDYLSKKRDKLIDKLNKKLREKDFYQDRFNTLLHEFEINLNDKSIILRLQEDIKLELKETATFFALHPQKFDDMELQVHEIRRKLRWISIYAQSLQGLIVLKSDKTKHSWEKTFITKADLSSPYNKLKTNNSLVSHIQFNQKAFQALNHVIAALGPLKDKSQAVKTLEKAIRKTNASKTLNFRELAQKQLKVSYTEEDLLKEAHVLLSDFFVKYKIHENLV